MSGWMDWWVDGLVDGWMDKWMGRLVDVWMDWLDGLVGWIGG